MRIVLGAGGDGFVEGLLLIEKIVEQPARWPKSSLNIVKALELLHGIVRAKVIQLAPVHGWEVSHCVTTSIVGPSSGR